MKRYIEIGSFVCFKIVRVESVQPVKTYLFPQYKMLIINSPYLLGQKVSLMNCFCFAKASVSYSFCSFGVISLIYFPVFSSYESEESGMPFKRILLGFEMK